MTTWVLYRKQSVRIKNAEAFQHEVEVLRKEIDELRKSLDFERKQREEDKKVISTVEGLNAHLYEAKNTLQIKVAQQKKALNRAFECMFCEDVAECPVMKQRRYNDDNELKEALKRN